MLKPKEFTDLELAVRAEKKCQELEKELHGVYGTLGRMAELSDIVLEWVLRLSELPDECRKAALEIMDYVDNVRPT